MYRQEAVLQYNQANKLGLKYYKNALNHGSYPYPKVLEELLRENQSAGRVELGLVDIPSELIVGTMAAGIGNTPANGFNQLIQMAASWMTVAKGAFHHYLGLGQISLCPTGSKPKRIQLRGKFTHFLTDQFHCVFSSQK